MLGRLLRMLSRLLNSCQYKRNDTTNITGSMYHKISVTEW